MLGMFRVIPPNGWKGWIVKVTSVHGKDWLVAVTIHPTKHFYHVRMVEKIPWTWWVGSNRPYSRTIDIAGGDIPVQAERARRQAQAEKDFTGLDFRHEFEVDHIGSGPLILPARENNNEA